MDIKTYREKHSLSQQAFGNLIGVSQGMVWQWEAGETDFTIDKVKKIAAVTGGEVSAHDLIPDTFPAGFEFPADPLAKHGVADRREQPDRRKDAA